MMYSRFITLLLAGTALTAAVPSDTLAQTRQGGVRVRTKCPECARDSTYRARQERLLLKIDSLRWQIEHVRMSPADRARLDNEMVRAVMALEASLDQGARTNDVIVARVAPEAPMPTRAFAYAITRKPHGYLGVTFDGQPAAEKVINGEHYIRFLQYPKIALVDASSPAERAGIVAGDTLVALGGHDVMEEISLTKVLVPRSRIIVRVRREGNSKELPVVIGETPEHYALREVPFPYGGAPVVAGGATTERSPRGRAPVVAYPTPRPSFSTRWQSDGVAGAQVKTISEGFAKALGAREGVLIIGVTPGTPAFASGLQDGDVILKADGRAITTVAALRNVVARGDGDYGVKLVILRERKQREITLRW